MKGASEQGTVAPAAPEPQPPWWRPGSGRPTTALLKPLTGLKEKDKVPHRSSSRLAVMEKA